MFHHFFVRRKMSRTIIPLLFYIVTLLIRNNDAVDLTIEQGTLRGAIFLSRNNTEYFGFLGIPFAKPPVGDLRFKPPQAPETWSGIRDATLPPPKCIQKEILTYDDHLRDIVGQEDCLYLNVFVPAAANRKTHPLPVMVYTHGGAYIVGDGSSQEPTYFMDHDVIIVTIQYRLNVFGFLSTGDDVVPGNNGMKDQTMAFKWVQKNIAAFGGNPNLVTIFGESAGSSSVHHHLHSPLSKGLFHRAICQSGTSLATWAYQSAKLARQRAFALGLLTGCISMNTQNLVDCLRQIPADELIIAHNKFYVWDAEPVIPFSIVAEPSTVEGAFITENPWYHDTVSNVPLIIGMTSAEGGVKASRYLSDNGTKAKYLNSNYKRILPLAFYYGSWAEEKEKVDQISESLKKFYFGDKNIGTETAKELIQLYMDGYFAISVLEAAKRYKGPKYFYLYDHRNKRTFNEIFGKVPEDLGVCHADDLISFFPLTGFIPKITEGDDFKVSERLVKYWVNFAISGNPNGHDTIWTPVQTNAIEYLHITTNKDQMESGLLKERYEFWSNLNCIPPRETKIPVPKYVNEL